MKTYSVFIPNFVLICVLGALPLCALAGSMKVEKRNDLALCSGPSGGCDSPAKKFAPYEMGFRLPRKLAANAMYQSVPFYAVVLRREAQPECDGGEFTRRLESFRRQFPREKSSPIINVPTWTR